MKRPNTPTIQLALGVGATFANNVFLATPPFLIPVLLEELELDLAQAGLMAVLPNLGMVVMLIAWGLLADRFGERFVLVLGLALTVVAALGGILTSDRFLLGACFLAGGMAGASANAASGRIVIGWASPGRRGRSMGIRQMSVPLAVMVAAAAVPSIADSYGVAGALVLPLAFCAIVLPCCAFGLRNPPRPSRSAAQTHPVTSNPYRRSQYLLHLHAASTMLSIPQLSLQTFGLVWLMSDLDWDPLAAGLLVGTAQFLGAAGRVVIGIWSDSIGRMRIIRHIAIFTLLVLPFLGLSAYMSWEGIAAVLFVLATCASVADNGPAFTSVAEFAGPFWSGRALGIQNTSQHLAGFAVAPVVGAMAGTMGFAMVLTLLAAAPAASLLFIPRTDQHYEDET